MSMGQETWQGRFRVKRWSAALIGLLHIDAALIGASLAYEGSFGDVDAFHVAGGAFAVVAVGVLVAWLRRLPVAGHSVRILPLVALFFAFVGWNALTFPLTSSDGPLVEGAEALLRARLGLAVKVSAFLQLVGALLVWLLRVDEWVGRDFARRPPLPRLGGLAIQVMFVSGLALFGWFAWIAYEPGRDNFGMWFLTPFIVGSAFGAVTWGLRHASAAAPLLTMPIVYAYAILYCTGRVSQVIGGAMQPPVAQVVLLYLLLAVLSAGVGALLLLPARYRLDAWFVGRNT